MTNEQKKHLSVRLEEAQRRQYYAIKDEPRPARVAIAERVIEQWQNECRRKRDCVRKKLNNRYIVAKEALLFHDAQKALAAVKKFEASK